MSSPGEPIEGGGNSASYQDRMSASSVQQRRALSARVTALYLGREVSATTHPQQVPGQLRSSGTRPLRP